MTRKAILYSNSFLLQIIFLNTKDNFTIYKLDGEYQILYDIKERSTERNQVDYKKEIPDLLEQKDEEEIYLREVYLKEKFKNL